MKKKRRNPTPAGRVRPRKTFVTRIPGVNISISLQPTRKGVMIVKPRVSRVTISRAGGNPRPVMTDALARAVALDAANAHMRAAGRKKWSRADLRIAVQTFNKLSPSERMVPNPFQMLTTPGHVELSTIGSSMPGHVGAGVPKAFRG